MAKQSIDPFRKVKSPFKPGQSVGTPTQVAGGGGGLKYVDPKVAIARAAENQAKRDAATGGGATTFKDPVTGRVTGVTSKGKTYLDLDPQEAEKLIEQEDFEAFAGSSGSTGAKGLSIVEANRLKAIQEEQQRLEAEEFPDVRQLDPQDRPGSELPIVGGIATPITNLIIQELSKKSPLFRDLVKTPLSPEDLRTAELTEIERRVYEEGVTSSEAFGIFVESIPIIGGLVSDYASGLVETPSGNVQEIRKKIKAHRRRATRMATNARTGVLSPEAAKEQLDQIELDIQGAESRIALLVNFSPNLRFNSDRVNTIETEILSAKDIILEAKIDISKGLITDPTEMNIYLESKRLNQEPEE